MQRSQVPARGMLTETDTDQLTSLPQLIVRLLAGDSESMLGGATTVATTKATDQPADQSSRT